MTDAPENFADHPIALDEVRAKRSNKACEASPRSTLIEALRAIDRGELELDALVVTYLRKDLSVGFIAASPNSTVSAGMLEKAKLKIMGALE